MTTDPERAELFAALSELARRYPHWRVGQLVANVAGWADAGVYDAEDGQLLAAVRGYLEAPADPAGAGRGVNQAPQTAGA